MAVVMTEQEISWVEAQAFAQGISLEEVSYTYEEYEQSIDSVQLILPPGVRSVAELEDLANAEENQPLIWTPENSRLFED